MRGLAANLRVAPSRRPKRRMDGPREAAPERRDDSPPLRGCGSAMEVDEDRPLARIRRNRFPDDVPRRPTRSGRDPFLERCVECPVEHSPGRGRRFGSFRPWRSFSTLRVRSLLHGRSPRAVVGTLAGESQGQEGTGLTLKYSRNWWREGRAQPAVPVLLHRPLSIETPTIETRGIYPSYPPGIVVEVHTVAKLCGREPGPAMVMRMNLATHLLTALCLGLTVFAVLVRNGFPARVQATFPDPARGHVSVAPRADVLASERILHRSGGHVPVRGGHPAGDPQDGRPPTPACAAARRRGGGPLHRAESRQSCLPSRRTASSRGT